VTTHPHTTEPRWRRLPEERPRQIVEAALEVFSEHGLAEARLEDIARRAGVSKGTIYLYFPNKEALFSEMIRQMVSVNIQDFAATLSDDESPRDQLERYMSYLWRYLRTPLFEKVYRLTMGELHKFPHLLRFFIEEVTMRSMRIVSGIIRRGVATGDFRAVEPEVAARIFHSTFVKHGIWCAQRDQIPFLAMHSDDEVFRQLVDFNLHALGLSPNVPGTSSRA